MGSEIRQSPPPIPSVKEKTCEVLKRSQREEIQLESTNLAERDKKRGSREERVISPLLFFAAPKRKNDNRSSGNKLLSFFLFPVPFLMYDWWRSGVADTESLSSSLPDFEFSWALLQLCSFMLSPT